MGSLFQLAQRLQIGWQWPWRKKGLWGQEVSLRVHVSLAGNAWESGGEMPGAGVEALLGGGGAGCGGWKGRAGSAARSRGLGSGCLGLN